MPSKNILITTLLILSTVGFAQNKPAQQNFAQATSTTSTRLSISVRDQLRDSLINLEHLDQENIEISSAAYHVIKAAEEPIEFLSTFCLEVGALEGRIRRYSNVFYKDMPPLHDPALGNLEKIYQEARAKVKTETENIEKYEHLLITVCVKDNQDQLAKRIANVSKTAKKIQDSASAVSEAIYEPHFLIATILQN